MGRIQELIEKDRKNALTDQNSQEVPGGGSGVKGGSRLGRIQELIETDRGGLHGEPAPASAGIGRVQQLLERDTKAAAGQTAGSSGDNLERRLEQLEAKRNELTAGLDLDGAAALYNNEIVPLRQQIKAQERADAAAQAANEQRTKLDSYTALSGAGDFSELAARGAAKVNEKTGAYGDIPGNIVRYYRQNEHPLYTTMTEQEVSIYDYLLGKGDNAGAQEYLELLNEELRRRQGVAKAQEIQNIENPVQKLFAYGGQAVGAGMDSAVQGAVQAFREERMPTSATQFASAALQEDLSGIGKYAYMAANTVGNMLPSIAIGTLTGGVGGAAALGVSASGNAYNQALQEGYGKGEARLYSALVGASEATLQYLLGGVSKLGGVTDDMLLARVGQLDSAFKRVLGTGAVKVGSEISEEELQLFLEPAIKSLVFDVPYDAPNFEEMAETAIVTALSTGALESRNIASARKDPLVTALFGGNSGETAQNTPPNAAGARTAVPAGVDTAQAERPAEGTQRRDVLTTAIFGPETENAASGVEADEIKATSGYGDGKVHHGNILEAVRGALDQIKGMGSVAKLTGTEFQKDPNDTRNLRTKVIDFFNSLGNKVVNPELGEIELNDAGARDSTGHGYGPLKAATFAALPDVLTKGKIIAQSGPYEGHNYDSLILSAPVDVNGVPCYVGALVIKDEKMQRYKLHEVLTTSENGTPLFKSESAGKTDGPLRSDAPLGEPGGSLDVSIPQSPTGVNSSAEAQKSGLQDSVGAARGGFDPFSHAELEYGTQDGGEKAVRPDDMPVSTNGRNRVSRTAVTVKGAAVTPDDFVPLLQGAVMDTKTPTGLRYMPVTNDATVQKAMDAISDKGWKRALADWIEDTSAGRVSEDTAAMGALLYNNAANAGDAELALDILSRYVENIRSGARAVQAARILKTLSPSHRLYMIQAAVQRYNEAQAQRESRKGRGVREEDNVPVEQWMKLVGEDLAGYIGRQTGTASGGTKAQTVSQTILKDLSRLHSQQTKTKSERGLPARTDMDRLQDMFANREQYAEAFEAARQRLAAEFGEDSGAVEAFDAWLEQAKDYAGRVSERLTGGTELKISDGLARRYLEAQTEAQRDEIIRQMQKEIAGQMKSTPAEKWRALRMVNMLGNFKTQIRNFGGNMTMRILAEGKNAAKTAVERLAGGRVGRTSSVFVNRALTELAKEDFAGVRNLALDGGRTTERFSANDFLRGAQEQKQIFSFAPLEGYRKATNWAMNNERFGDEGFLKSAYARFLSGYLNANGVTAEQFSNPAWKVENTELVDKARSYALQQAQETTFRDRNRLTDLVTKLAGSQKTSSVWGMFVDGIMPFRRTPANVLLRAEQYSPLGLFNAAVNAVKAARGTATGQDVVESLARALSGSALFALGMLGRNAGMLRGKEDEDEDQAAFDELTGHQEYALELEDGTSITLDWLAPAAVPLFMGAKLEELRQEGGISLDDLWTALSSVSDPLLEMSMLSGLNEALEGVQYAQGNAMENLFASAVMDYFLQGLSNSLLGQVSRSLREESLMTYVDKESSLPALIQRTLGEASRKFPGDGYNQIPYIDAWGQTEESGDPIVRAVNNLFNPAYVSKVETGGVERELQRLYDSTGDGSVLPDRAGKYFSVDGKRKDLTGEEYVQYATAKGKNSYELVKQAMDAAAYAQMGAAQRADLVAKMYGYADYKAKKSVAPTYENDTWAKYAAAEAAGMSPVEYYVLRENIDADGSNKQGTPTKAEAKMYLDGQTKLNQSQKADLWDLIQRTDAWAKANPYRK